MKKLSLFFALTLPVMLVSCSNNEKDQTGREENAISDTVAQRQNFVLDTITNALVNPWGIAFLPDGRILITERAGEIRIVENGNLLEEKIQGVPKVFNQGQGGLLDIQLDPDYEENGWLYLTYAKPVSGGAVTTLTRTKLNGNQFTDLEEIFVAQPVFKTAHHFGSRIAFDEDGYLFVSAGERGTKENSQDLSNDYGKIHRLNKDGSIPEDNPFVDSANAKASIWSYGHRNMQGLYYDRATGILWEHEHGPKGGDELNIVEKGKNYGWPVVTYGIDYDGSVISEIAEKEGIQNPVHYWDPSIAPCGMTMVKGDLFPGWEGDLLIGALAHQHVARVDLEGKEAVKVEKLLQDIGRVRAVVQAPDGHIYVATEGTGLLLKISPTK